MQITITVSQEDLAMIRQGLMCAAATSRDHGHNKQATEFHDCCNRLPDPFFPAKPELPPIREDMEGKATNVGNGEEWVCRACKLRYSTKSDAEDCLHDTRDRALYEIRYLKAVKPENWEYKVSALEYHYVNN